jgi:hypothetical protein
LNQAEQLIYDKIRVYFPDLSIQIKAQGHRVQFKIGNANLSCWKDEWEDKEDIIVSRIGSLLGRNKRIHGRLCEVKLIDKKTAEAFLNKHHVLGFANAYYKLGLYKKEELLAIATFSKGRKMNRLPEGKKSFELVRFCNASGITVVGGLSKLLKHFVTLSSAGDIMTYIDKEQSEGKAFLNLGFKLMSESMPIEFNVHKNSLRRFEKHEAHERHNFHTIKNSGNLKLVYTPKYD